MWVLNARVHYIARFFQEKNCVHYIARFFQEKN